MTGLWTDNPAWRHDSSSAISSSLNSPWSRNIDDDLVAGREEIKADYVVEPPSGDETVRQGPAEALLISTRRPSSSMSVSRLPEESRNRRRTSFGMTRRPDRSMAIVNVIMPS